MRLAIADPPRRRWTLEVPTDRESPARARWFFWSKLAEYAPNELDAAMLLLSELVTNAVRHGAESRDAPIEVALEVGSAPAVLVAVRDRGRGLLHPSVAPQPEVDGWGLHLVEAVSARWGYDREGGTTVVWFELG
jgi:anti-sigma regulatory factor (Ser/Thr protein kinase)